MTNELEMKLKEYGFPEPDELGINAKYFGEKCILSICHDSLTSFVYITRPDVSPSCLGITLCTIKTDSDWKAVAGFVKFIKGE